MKNFHVQHIFFNREERGEPTYSLMSCVPFFSEEDQCQIGSAWPPMSIRENDAGMLNKYLRKIPQFHNHHGLELYEGQLDAELEILLSLYMHHNWILVSTCSKGESEMILFFQNETHQIKEESIKE